MYLMNAAEAIIREGEIMTVCTSQFTAVSSHVRINTSRLLQSTTISAATTVACNDKSMLVMIVITI